MSGISRCSAPPGAWHRKPTCFTVDILLPGPPKNPPAGIFWWQLKKRTIPHSFDVSVWNVCLLAWSILLGWNNKVRSTFTAELAR